MLKKKERLTKKEFDRFFSMGKKFHTPTLQMIYTPHSTLHVAVVVSKKVYKTAVKRNKLRRQIYDMVRRHYRNHPTTGVFIIITKPKISELPREEIQEELLQMIEKINN